MDIVVELVPHMADKLLTVRVGITVASQDKRVWQEPNSREALII